MTPFPVVRRAIGKILTVFEQVMHGATQLVRDRLQAIEGDIAQLRRDGLRGLPFRLQSVLTGLQLSPDGLYVVPDPARLDDILGDPQRSNELTALKTCEVVDKGLELTGIGLLERLDVPRSVAIPHDERKPAFLDEHQRGEGTSEAAVAVLKGVYLVKRWCSQAASTSGAAPPWEWCISINRSISTVTCSGGQYSCIEPSGRRGLLGSCL